MLSCRQDFEQGLGHITVGSVSEWSMVQHWKCCVPKGTGSSNLSASVSKKKCMCCSYMAYNLLFIGC